MGRQRPEAEAITESIDSGVAELVPEVGSRSSWTLRVNGTPQSHVDLDDPTYLEFEYVRRLGHVVDLVAPARVLHLGGGALTLARYVAATVPRSTQQVAEIDAGLIAFIRRELPPPPRVKITTGDARAVLARTRPGSFDLIVSDCFAGARTPAHLTSVEYVRQASDALAGDGVYAANIGDGNGLQFARSQCATVRAVFEHVCVLAEPGVFRGRRFGNLVIFASHTGLPMQQLTRATASDPFQGRVEHGTGLTKFIGGAPVTTDETATLSPAPPSGLWGT
ncbi:spermine synthase [Lentzea guizhouensis]|uniref:Spermine synthase n=1 Tax=Lentzea guizhouensis TaxID=1586287 RepID=A0A1B2HMK7_9PSEU|nr:fused MFS/spermidine synthase [Lentzea guizhouensis]ANZ38967.1 spermine synthase [Lentzea guizhouensis]